jgi:hypothetical protein
MTPVMQIIHELQELGGKTSPPLSMAHLQVELIETCAVTSAPLVEPGLGGEKGIEVGALAPTSEDIFATELCDLFARLEAAIPGSGKKIACILTEKTSRDKVHKVKEYLRSKKSGTIRKESRLFDG